MAAWANHDTIWVVIIALSTFLPYFSDFSCSQITATTTSPIFSSCGRSAPGPEIHNSAHFVQIEGESLHKSCKKHKRKLHQAAQKRKTTRLNILQASLPSTKKIISSPCQSHNDQTSSQWKQCDFVCVAAKLPKYQVQPMHTLSESNGMKFLVLATLRVQSQKHHIANVAWKGSSHWNIQSKAHSVSQLRPPGPQSQQEWDFSLAVVIRDAWSHQSL